MISLIYKDEVYAIQGAIYDVNQNLGCGFLEAVYQEALEIELKKRNIPFIPQSTLNIMYKNVILKKQYRVDFFCYGKIIVEIKSEKRTTDIDKAQLMNYLKISQCSLGLLVNFGSYPKATVERIAMNHEPREQRERGLG